MRLVELPDFSAGDTTAEALALGLSADSAAGFFGLALRAFRQADLEAAYDASFLSLSCDRTKLDAWSLFAAVCAQRHAYSEAQLCFKHVLAQKPEHLGALVGLAELAIAEKDLAAAAAHLQKVVQLDPNATHEASMRARSLLLARPQWKLGLDAIAGVAGAQKKPAPNAEKPPPSAPAKSASERAIAHSRARAAPQVSGARRAAAPREASTLPSASAGAAFPGALITHTPPARPAIQPGSVAFSLAQKANAALKARSELSASADDFEPTHDT